MLKTLEIPLNQTTDSHRTSFVVAVSFQYQDMIRRVFVNDVPVNVFCINFWNNERTMIGLGGHEEIILSSWASGVRQQFFEGSRLYEYDKTFPV